MLEPINISLDSLNLGTIAPVSVAIIGALGILLTDIFNKNKHKSLYIILVVLFLINKASIVQWIERRFPEPVM